MPMETYLVWIGVHMILSRDKAGDVAAAASGQAHRLYRQGFVTSMANPFAVVFFGALMIAAAALLAAKDFETQR